MGQYALTGHHYDHEENDTEGDFDNLFVYSGRVGDHTDTTGIVIYTPNYENLSHDTMLLMASVDHKCNQRTKQAIP